MKKSWLWGIVVCVLMMVFCAGAGGEATIAVIDGMDADRVHLREEPSQSATSLGLFFTGTEVRLLNGGNGEWAQVQIGSQQGYMMTKYLRQDVESHQATNRQPKGALGGNAEEVPVWYTLPATEQPDGSINRAAVLTILGETEDGFYYAQAVGLRFYVEADAIWITDGNAAPAAKACRLLRQVVDDQTPYMDAMSGRELLLSQYELDVEDAAYGIGRFAIADLDRDTIMEVAVEVQLEGYPFCYLLLDERNGRVYGYEIPARGFLQLKTDGTAMWSHGASSYGFGWRADWNGDPAAGTIALCEVLEDQSTYVVHGELTTLEAFQEAEWQQHIKPDAVWYWPTDDNLTLLFE